MSIYLGVDIGTQAVKALCIDAGKHQLAAVPCSDLELVNESDGKREQPADWSIDALNDCLSQINLDIKHSVCAVAFPGNNFTTLIDE